MTDPQDPRAGRTRERILLAAAAQFSHQPYDVVRLDDIIATAGVTKGAIYFHFRSKHAVALAVIDKQREALTEAVTELFERRLSGLETLVEICFLFAAEDTGDDPMRAAVNLMESIGLNAGLRASYYTEWIKHFAMLIERGITEGDVNPAYHPEDISRLLVSLFVGVRQRSDPGNADHYVGQLERAWAYTLPGFANPSRIGYFTEYIRRRTQSSVRT